MIAQRIVLTLTLAVSSCHQASHRIGLEGNDPALLSQRASWFVRESQHIILYAPSGNYAINDIALTMMSVQESNLKRICAIMRLDIDSVPKVRLWLFHNIGHKYFLTGVASPAHTIVRHWSSYYTPESCESAHEMAHLLSLRYWGEPRTQKFTYLTNEGFAFYCDEEAFFHGEFYCKARKLLGSGIQLDSVLLNLGSASELDKSVVTGAFVKYLIEHYGLAAWVELWVSVENNPVIFEQVYGKTFGALQSEFTGAVSTRPCH